ncbi:MAG: DUF1573 domain-containing protein [Planctomycetota bacterium]|nr:MAG: DUF1573 domain-containing protein [Planctomycetota bacterium]
MKFKSLPLYLLLSLCPLYASPTSSTPPKKCPRLQIVGQKYYEFGTIIQGQTVKHRFRFKNAGNAPLRIVKIKPSCYCSSSKISKRILQPGEEASLVLEFHSEGLESRYYDLWVDVYHNDPTQKDVGKYVTRFYMSGQVKTLFRFAPAGASYLGNFESRYPPSKTILLFAEHLNRFRITKIEYNPKLLHIQYSDQPIGKGKIAKKITIQLKPNIPPGYFFTPIKFYTSDKQQKIVFFKLVGMAIGDLQREPDYLLFGPIQRTKNLPQKSIHIFLRRGSDLQILKIEYDTNFFEAKLLPLLEKKRYELTLTIRPNAPVGPFTKLIRIYTNQPHQPVLTTVAQGNILPRVEAYPAALYLRGRVGQTLHAKTRIRSLVGAKFQAKLLPLKDKTLQAKLLPLEDNEYELQLTLPPRKTSGEFYTHIQLQLNLPGESQLTIPVYGRILE